MFSLVRKQEAKKGETGLGCVSTSCDSVRLCSFFCLKLGLAVLDALGIAKPCHVLRVAVCVRVRVVYVWDVCVCGTWPRTEAEKASSVSLSLTGPPCTTFKGEMFREGRG